MSVCLKVPVCECLKMPVCECLLKDASVLYTLSSAGPFTACKLSQCTIYVGCMSFTGPFTSYKASVLYTLAVFCWSLYIL